MSSYLPVMISAAMFLISLAAFVRTSRQDTSAESAERAKMSADLSYIRQSVDDIRTESRITRSDVKNLEGRVAKVESSAASAHRRLDDYLKGVHHEH